MAKTCVRSMSAFYFCQFIYFYEHTQFELKILNLNGYKVKVNLSIFLKSCSKETVLVKIVPVKTLLVETVLV